MHMRRSVTDAVLSKTYMCISQGLKHCGGGYSRGGVSPPKCLWYESVAKYRISLCVHVRDEQVPIFYDTIQSYRHFLTCIPIHSACILYMFSCDSGIDTQFLVTCAIYMYM